MGELIELRSRKAGPSVKSVVETLSQHALNGRMKGLIFVMELDDGEQITGVCGSFAADLNKAAEAAHAGFNCILGHSRCLEIEPQSKLPRRLRKEIANDKTCDVAGCSCRHRVA